MGIEPFLVTASVNLVLAQRLGRRLCSECKVPDESLTEEALLDAGVKPEALAKGYTPYVGKGCAKCDNKGYKGRIAFYEVMVFDDVLKELVLQGASTAELKAEAIRRGMDSLRMAGLKKVGEGMSTVAEVLRITSPD
jgi:type IV pilus assembly protein PilB